MALSEDNQPPVTMDHQMLSPVDRDVIVDLLLHGDNTPQNIARNTERSPSSVSRRLSTLKEKGIVRNKGSGVWTLKEEGILMGQTIYYGREESRKTEN